MRNGLGKPRASLAPLTAQYSQSYAKGVLVSLSNPKALIFFLALFPSFTKPESFMHDMVYFGVLKMVCLLSVMCVYALTGQKIFQYLNSSKWGNIASKALGGGIIFAAITIVSA